MPTISLFYGVAIRMHWRDHGPPHFHAVYESFRVSIDLRTLEIIQGTLPPRALALVLEWASIHQGELMENWHLCAAKRAPKRIAPLN